MEKLKYKEAFAKILKSKLPFVLYSKPDEEDVYGFLQKDVNLWFVQDLEKDKGFVFAPYSSEQEKILIKSDAKLHFDMEGSDEGFNFKSMQVDNLFENKVEGPDQKIEKEKHIKLVSKAIESLKDGELDKVVIAREELWKANKVDFSAIYSDLVFEYPEAFVYIFFHPLVGMWIGATPELFLEFDDESAHSNSLAATKKSDDNRAWTEKEEQEQQIVSDYIQEIFDKNMLNAVKTHGPRTVQAGALEHLKSDITGLVSEMTNFNYLINQLHPTPAVCGQPLDKAKEFIENNEGFNRYFYTGFLGELNIDDRSEFYVNLRCLQVVREGVKFFMGGGITAKSDPEAEWNETTAKSAVLKDIVLKHLK
jgi:isochorismate synthase